MHLALSESAMPVACASPAVSVREADLSWPLWSMCSRYHVRVAVATKLRTQQFARCIHDWACRCAASVPQHQENFFPEFKHSTGVLVPFLFS